MSQAGPQGHEGAVLGQEGRHPGPHQQTRRREPAAPRRDASAASRARHPPRLAGLGDRPKEAPKPAAPAAAPAAAPPKKLSVAEEAAANKAEAAGIVKEAQKAYDARIADREKAKTASKDELQKLIDLKISGGAAPAAEEKKAE